MFVFTVFTLANVPHGKASCALNKSSRGMCGQTYYPESEKKSKR